MILGAKYDEVEKAHETILQLAETQHVVCIIDQNLDNYLEGKMVGTDIVEKLVDANFKGLTLMRSANDSVKDIEFYRSKGAHDTLSKTFNVATLAMQVLEKCQQYYSQSRSIASST